MIKATALILLLALLAPSLQQIQHIDLPVSFSTQSQVNFRINHLKMMLPSYNWIYCNKHMLYSAVTAASQILHRAAEEMKKGSGNHVQGSNNIVGGFGNVVLGSNNLLVGINSWLFTTGYSTPYNKVEEGILVIGNYRIILSKVNQIHSNPTLAISMVNGAQFNRLKHQNVAVSYFFR